MLTIFRSNLTSISPRTWAGLAVGWLVWLYIFINFALNKILPASLSVFAIQPVLWLSLAGLSGMAYNSLAQRQPFRRRLARQPAFSRRLVVWAVLVGLLQSALFFIISFAFPFGRSSAGHDALVMLGNVFYVVAFTAAIEVSRAFLGTALGIRNPGGALVLLAVLFAIAGIPTAQFARLSDPATTFVFLSQTLLPALARNLLATYLAMTGGPLVSACYMVVPALVQALAPILPNPPWVLEAFYNTLFPVLALYDFRRWLVQPEADPARQ